MSEDGFFKKWAQGIRDLSITQQLHSQMLGHWGSIFGTCFAWFYLVKIGFWYFSILLFFTIFLQVIQLIGTRQKYVEAKRLEEMIKNSEDVMKKELEQNGGKN